MQTPRPVSYTIRIEPDLQAFDFAGEVFIEIHCPQPARRIRLNILDIAVWHCEAQQGADRFTCAFQVDPSDETLTLLLPHDVSGKLTVSIRYSGKINDKMAGFYRSAYPHDGRSEHIAVTQFQESDARRVFPCFDHPAQKATFDITLHIDEGLTAVSNMDVAAEKSAGNGKRRVTFRRTPKMSTYLVFMGVGRFDFTTDRKDRRVRVATVPGRIAYAESGLDFGRKALAFCEDYFGIDYPLPKMDLLAIPDFAFGAMENWGAVTFRENLLLDYPGVTSLTGKTRIFEVVAHEITHQWFGNLVTPADWKFLWLNESFATYFGYGTVHHYFPQWLTWEQFLLSQTASAMVRDGLNETFAIEIPGGEHVVINTSTAPIIYSKGGSILRQIEGHIGPQNFRKGLQRYLETHAYGNAASQDLWQALEQTSDQPVASMMKRWVSQPGFPLVEVRRKGGKLLLTQQRFTYLPTTCESVWPIPLQVALFDAKGKLQTRSLLMEGRQAEIDIGENVAAYKVNPEQTGFYRVSYLDHRNLEALGKLSAGGNLGSPDRWGLENDLFALLKRGDRSLANYLEFLGHYRKERAYLPMVSMVFHLLEIFLVVPHRRGEVCKIAGPLIDGVLAQIGFQPHPDEPYGTSLLRDPLLWPAVVFGSGTAADAGQELFEKLRQGHGIAADIMKGVMQIAAACGDMDTYAWFVRRMETTDSEHERLNILAALGCFRQPDCIAALKDFILEKVPARNKFIPVVSMASNPEAVSGLWEWFVARLGDFEKFHPMFFERVIAAIVPVAGLEAPDAVREFFAQYMQTHPQAEDVIKLSLEKMEINLALRNRCR